MIVATVALFILVAPQARAAERKPVKKPVTLEVVFHVAEMDGQPVADATYLDERLERANQIFAPYGVGFARSARR